jgi:predicted enzyme related to lactoylglutathione lyase
MARTRGTDPSRAHIGMDLFGPAPDFAGLARSMGWWAEGPIENRRSPTGASAGGRAGQDGQACIGRRGDAAPMNPALGIARRMPVEFLCSCCQAGAAGAASVRLGQIPAEETGMAMQLGHVHIKTREDPQKVAKFYIDNFGATVKRETPGRGCQLDLHGVQLNVTTINADQNHEQHVGIEHIAIETDDYAAAVANFKKNGAQILEERVNNGRHVCWVAAPDGAQMELIEKV